MANDRLRLLFCDHLNIARGKYLPADKLKADGTYKTILTKYLGAAAAS